MSYLVDFNNVPTVGLESSSVAEAFDGYGLMKPVIL
jgi:hypothetical protein